MSLLVLGRVRHGRQLLSLDNIVTSHLELLRSAHAPGSAELSAVGCLIVPGWVMEHSRL